MGKGRCAEERGCCWERLQRVQFEGVLESVLGQVHMSVWHGKEFFIRDTSLANGSEKSVGPPAVRMPWGDGEEAMHDRLIHIMSTKMLELNTPLVTVHYRTRRGGRGE